MKTENLSIKKNDKGAYDVLINGKPTDLLIKSLDFHLDTESTPTATFTVYLPDGVELDVDGDILYRFTPKPEAPVEPKPKDEPEPKVAEKPVVRKRKPRARKNENA